MKILYLGTNTDDTYQQVKSLSESTSAVFHGIISKFEGQLPSIINEGYYFSSVYDLEYGTLVKLADKFDKVTMLDQPKKQYNHPNGFYKTINLVKSLPNGEFVNNNYKNLVDYWQNIIDTNKSFCIIPFISVLADYIKNQTLLCGNSSAPLIDIKDIDQWAIHGEYTTIRDKMLEGTAVPENCSRCYYYEKNNIRSPRQELTMEWTNTFDIESIDDLKNITKPMIYEIISGNICNLQCRMCSPRGSHLISKEYKKINLIANDRVITGCDFAIVDFTNLKKLYVTGGEPTAQPEFHKFIDKCIQNKQTDFQFLINTNATKLSNSFKQQLKNFSNVQFVVSLDGYKEVNHYIRWPSIWDNIVENTRYLVENNHKVVINITVSIWNVITLFELLEFIDTEFPEVLINLGHCESSAGHLSEKMFPDSKLALAKLLRIRDLNCYNNMLMLKSFVDSMINHYQSDPTVDLTKLALFFEFNDKLDESRNIKLVDYVPELEQARKLL